LEEIFKRKIDLDLYTAKACIGDQANRYWLQFVDSQTDGSSSLSSQQSFSKTAATNIAKNVLPQQIQSKLTKVAKSGLKRLASRRLLGSFSSISNKMISILPHDRVKIDHEVIPISIILLSLTNEYIFRVFWFGFRFISVW